MCGGGREALAELVAIKTMCRSCRGDHKSKKRDKGILEEDLGCWLFDGACVCVFREGVP